MPDVLCIGNICADVLVKPLDALPGKGRLELTSQLRLELGGCASNAAVDLARLGISVGIAGKVSSDGFGRHIRSILIEEGVDVTGLIVDENTPTSASVVCIGSDAERSIIHCLGSNATLGADDINLSLILSSKAVFIAGTFLLSAFDGAGAASVLKKACEAGILCCMDTAWDSSGKWLNTISCCLPYLDWFMPSIEEAAAMTGEKQPERIADNLLSLGAKNIIIKMGKDGCYLKTTEVPGFIFPAFSRVKAVDTSGAGDSFCAGFIAGLLSGWKHSDCAVFANAVGSHCVMKVGTTAGVKSMEEIKRFIREYE